MFIVSGASGHTGQVVASALLERGKKVRVLLHDAKKGAAWQARGAEVVAVDLHDAAALTAALRGAEGVWAMVPPDFAADDPLGRQRAVAEAWGQAVAAARPAHVVLLSSIGAQLPEGTGPIQVAHRAEEAIAASGVPLTALRAAYFLENWGGMVGAVRDGGVLPSMLTPGRAISMVATADIGRVGAEALLEGPRGRRVIELAGPRDHTPEEIAAAFGRALGRDITLVPVPEAGIEPALAQAGFKPRLAALFREMTVALNQGRIAWTGTPVRGRVGLDEVVRRLLG